MSCRTWRTLLRRRARWCARTSRAPTRFLRKPVTIAANRHVHLLLDRKTLTTAYPLLTVSGGKGASIRLTYAEALYDEQQQKGDRNEVGNRQALGVHDRFLPDGGAASHL